MTPVFISAVFEKLLLIFVERSTLSPAQTSVAEAVISISWIDTVTVSLSVLSQSSTVCEAYTNCPSVNAVEGSSKLPPVAASYHWILSPVAVKSATVAVSQNNCSASPVGAAGTVTLIVMYSLHLTPLVTTSTQ